MRVDSREALLWTNNNYLLAVADESGAIPDDIAEAYLEKHNSDLGVVDLETEDITEPVSCGIGECIPEPETTVAEPINIPEEKMFYSCSGCELEGKCYAIGHRKERQYCSDNNEFIDQSKAGTCENHFECRSNVCISDECIEESLIKRFIEWFKRVFGAEPKPAELKQCSELLIEKNIKDHKYTQSIYGEIPGENEYIQAPLYSEDGNNTGTIKCCAAQYIDKENKEDAVMFCPYGNREDVINSVEGIMAEDSNLVFGEYKGNNIFGDDNGELVAWTSDTYILVVGLPPGRNLPLSEDLADAYLDKYSSDLETS